VTLSPPWKKNLRSDKPEIWKMRRNRDGLCIKIVRRKENGRIGMEEIFEKSS
jgi:hypothetical protein